MHSMGWLTVSPVVARPTPPYPPGDKLDIKEGPSGLYIPNLRIEAVNSPEDVAAVLQKGKQNRSTFATNMNEHSSRSHLVLSIYAVAKHLTKGEACSECWHDPSSSGGSTSSS